MTYTYDAAGRKATEGMTIGGQTDTTATAYDAAGRVSGSTYPDATAVGRTYTDNTLASITHSGAAVGNYTYGWDTNKNKTSEAISGYGFDVGTSGYDDEDRLVNWNRSDNGLDQSWNLSLIGDWNSFTENASSHARPHSRDVGGGWPSGHA